jgi:G3E family GTPase
MNLLCVAGFLGSGKTTMLLELARRMAAAGLSIAVIENEIGEVGVDGDAVREQELPVVELFGGCICCTLRASLLGALRTVHEDYAPDWAIVEPTGLAAPGEMVSGVRHYVPQIGQIRVLTLVDAERWDVLSEVAAPLVTAQIEAADVIALTKTDLVDEESLRVVFAAVRDVGASVPIIKVAVPARVGVDDLAAVLIP